MEQQKSKEALSKSFFFISFLPAIAYWYLETNYPLRVALAGGLLLAIIELILEKIFTKHLHAISKFNFCLIAILGGISLLGDEGIWFKLQPAFTGVIFGGYLLVSCYRGNGLISDMAKTLNENPPPEIILKTMEIHLGIFLVIYGFFMVGVAVYFNTSQWLFFKTAGFYIATGIFFVFELFYMRRIALQMRKRSQQAELLKNLNPRN